MFSIIKSFQVLCRIYCIQYTTISPALSFPRRKLSSSILAQCCSFVSNQIVETMWRLPSLPPQKNSVLLLLCLFLSAENFELQSISNFLSVSSESLLQISFCCFPKEVYCCFSAWASLSHWICFTKVYVIWLIHLIKVFNHALSPSKRLMLVANFLYVIPAS